jgi:hypothetical protein
MGGTYEYMYSLIPARLEWNTRRICRFLPLRSSTANQYWTLATRQRPCILDHVRGALLIIHHRGKRNRRAAALRSKLITFGGTGLQLIIVSIHSISEMAKHTHGITSVILSASVAQPGKACIRFRSDVCVLEKVQGCTLLARM